MTESPVSPRYGIAELAAEFGVTARTLRHYEEIGLLHPARDGARRIYAASDRIRLRLALRGRRIGLSLAECREIIDMYRAPTDEQEQIRVLLRKIAEREAELVRRRDDLDATLGELHRVRMTVQSGARHDSVPSPPAEGLAP